MVLFWDIFFWAIPIFVFILIPFMTFFYEADDGMLMAGTSVGAKPNSRLCEAIKYEIAVLIVFGGLFITGYLLLGESALPVQSYSGAPATVTFETENTGANTFTTNNLANFGTSDQSYSINTSQTRQTEEIIIPVTIPTFFAGFMSFIGWFFFALFGGIGLAAVPLDLILHWVHRPKHMDPSEFADAQLVIRSRVNDLVSIGEMMKLDRDEKAKTGTSKGFFSGMVSKEAREERNTLLEFKKSVYLLEEDVEEFQACTANYENYNPLWPWLSLFSGILMVLVSIFWIAHIIIFMIPPRPLTPFLNGYFQWFDSWFPLFGVLSVAIFTLFLLLCAVKGCFKFGIRFMMFQIHPMKVNKTYMSSFMFNVGLILLCALPVVQFCTAAFSDYARYTNISQIMGTQVQYLRFLSWFWNTKFFVYIILGVFGLTVLVLWCRPRDKAGTESISLRDRLTGGGRKRD